MRKALIVLTVAALSLAACNKSDNKKPAVGEKHAPDAVQNKLAELAGNSGKDCGRLGSQDPGQLKVASDCAMSAAKDKQPFYVGYDMPGMTVGVAGDSQGKLFAIQSDANDVKSGPCPSDIRIAPSGRVTCFAPGSMGMGGMSPHGSAQPGMPSGMPPSGTANPHGGMGTTAPGTPNPHAGTPAPTKQH
jgi:hypothetical protein